MAVEFKDQWASAVLEGNEIVPNLVMMSASRSNSVSMNRVPERLTLGQLERCWTSETLQAPKGWRERLTLRQAKEFEIIYCTAVLWAGINLALNDCAWMRDGATVGCTIRSSSHVGVYPPKR